MSEKIRIMMLKRGMTRKGLADALGWSPASLGNKLKRNNFTYNDLRKIADALGCEYVSEFVIPDTGERV